jgi:hypothetical protein
MNKRRIFPAIFITIGLAITLVIISVAIPIKTSDRFDRTQRGWPLSYHRTIDTRGDCIGFLGELPREDGSCNIRHFPVSYTNLAINFLLYLVFIGAIVGTISSRIHPKRR